MIVNSSLGHLKISIGDTKDFFEFIKIEQKLNKPNKRNNPDKPNKPDKRDKPDKPDKRNKPIQPDKRDNFKYLCRSHPAQAVKC